MHLRLRDVRPAGTASVADLAAFRAGRTLCAICRHWVRRERLWADLEGRLWDVCTGCGTAADGYAGDGFAGGATDSGTR